jgi:hypothetical protein
MAPNTNGLLIIERILRDRDSIWKQIGEERDLGRLIGQMLASSAIALGCYGAVLGASHSIGMSAISAVKLPLLFLMTLAICLPTLYLFNLVFGARLQVRQALALVMVTVTVTSVLSLAFAPIALFFRITAHSYQFYKMLNVAILALTAIVGLKFLTSGMQALNRHTTNLAIAKRAKEEAEAKAAAAPEPVEAAPEVEVEQPEPVAVGATPANQTPAPPALERQPARPPMMLMPNGQYQPYPQAPRLPGPHPQPALAHAAPGERPASMTLLYVWIVLFGFVGTQLAWTLRPFVGSPGEPFEIFRQIDGNFYVDIVRTIGNLF